MTKKRARGPKRKPAVLWVVEEMLSGIEPWCPRGDLSSTIRESALDMLRAARNGNAWGDKYRLVKYVRQERSR